MFVSATPRSLRVSTLALAMMACPASPTWAQETQQLPVISVTGEAVETAEGPVPGYVARRSSAGSKTDTPLVETPQSISVVTRQQMDDQAAQTLDQALRYVPAVYSQDNDLRFDQLTIRGFAADSYLDGMKLNRTTWFANPRIDPYFLERIDVLRGPASVLYGQASPGGLVDMVSKRPTAEPLHSIEMGIGNDQRYQLGFDFGGPVDQDGKWLYRVTGLGRDANTQTRHVEEQRIGIAPALTWQPSGDTRLTFLGGYQYDPQGGLFNPVPAYGTVRWNPNGKLRPEDYLGNPDTDRFRRTQYSAGYLLEHRFNDLLQVRQNVRYLHDDVDYYQTSLSSPLTPDRRSAYMWANINREHMSQFTIDNQAQFDFSTGPLRHTVLAGVDYQYLQNDIRRGGQFFSNYPIDLFNPDYAGYPRVPVTVDETTRLAQVGAYLQEQLRWDRWALTLGARKDYASSRDVQDNAMTGANMVSSRTGDHAFTWRGGLTYRFDNGIAPYASYSTSFQPQSGADWNGNPFIPTRGKQYELGIKFQPDAMRSYATVAVFDLRQTNVVTPDPDPSHPQASVQSGEIRSRGLELEAHAELTRELSVIASYAYLDNVVAKANNATQGKHPTGIPKHMASTWADYTIRGGDLNGLGFGAGVRYVGQTYGSADNDLVLPERVLVDAAVHYDTGRWRFALNASNLFNKAYLAYCTNPTVCYWGASRTVLATARYQW
ncbi:TonB-dependent receptor [Bordetella sp. H567]|uniref:TonB-dependent siderophore receptor n=1 Tax=Bordetella sp. H567 TaxID=1697043 RepID=UPI00081C8907|nr:TonB-dependent siderophore receptor [Bordetella sp. H567]AOB31969.1 TonB-dependent receptor [Bordetella sp. H567]